MTLRRFELFVSIAKHLSITQASRELHVSQPAVSQQLKRLQDDFGTLLVKKNGKGIALTEPGRVFAKEALSILSQVDGLKNKFVESLVNPSANSLTLAGSHGPSTSLLPALLARFKKSHPAAIVTLHTGNSREIEELILTSKVDLAVITNPSFSPSLETELYGAEKLTAFVPAHHPLAKKHRLDPLDLPQIPLVVRVGRQGQTRTEDRLSSFAASGAKLKIAMRCESPESLKEAVRNGAGVGILPYDIVRRDIERGEFRVVKLAGIDLAVQSYIVYSKQRPLPTTARHFLPLLRAAAKRQRSVKTVLPRGKSGLVASSLRDG